MQEFRTTREVAEELGVLDTRIENTIRRREIAYRDALNFHFLLRAAADVNVSHGSAVRRLPLGAIRGRRRVYRGEAASREHVVHDPTAGGE